ncbi:Cytochrome P450 6a2 [Eumeta japonica]|uniref:unspecific monooxygenase n=1 Tax=Eumeta variegata TaxID=151549 RepID=A0A4C1XBW6_EUMVA|nr:Cytochrome P450 6a2 [Eumeta japonica]
MSVRRQRYAKIVTCGNLPTLLGSRLSRDKRVCGHPKIDGLHRPRTSVTSPELLELCRIFKKECRRPGGSRGAAALRGLQLRAILSLGTISCDVLHDRSELSNSNEVLNVPQTPSRPHKTIFASPLILNTPCRSSSGIPLMINRIRFSSYVEEYRALNVRALRNGFSGITLFRKGSHNIIRDPELVKAVLVSDFMYFYKRGLNPHETVIEPMLKNLFFAHGNLWRLLRQRMTPAFTTGKLKAMFPLIVERAVKVQNLADKAAKTGATVDVRDLMARYTIDFIGACDFGINMDSLDEENSVFRKMGKRIFSFTRRDALIRTLKHMFPETCKNLHFLTSEVEKTTLHLVKTVMKERDYTPSGRNDFIDLLLALKENGKLVGESVDKFKPDGPPMETEIELDDLLMAAQVLVLLLVLKPRLQLPVTHCTSWPFTLKNRRKFKMK